MSSRWFVRGDIDGFFGLFIDNLVQLLLIDVLCRTVCGMPDELVVGRILPAAAISILIGNFFYTWQAHRLMARTGRDDVTALPYGINTPSLIAYVIFIMGPVYHANKAAGPDAAAKLAWQAGLFACLLSGVMECAGAFVGDWLRRYTPRAALLSALAGIALTFIAMGFVFQIFAAPAVALVPMMIVLVAYACRQRLPLGLPGGLVAVIVGVALGWAFHLFAKNGVLTGWSSWQPLAQKDLNLALHLPRPVPADVLALFQSAEGWKYMAVIIPMGLFNVIGSLQNLESAEAAGDRYETRPSLLANGLGSIVAALFGSAFPTTIYIGHPGWKAMGARAGYSLLNGVVVTAICLFGALTLVQNLVPLEATLGILLWIGIIITAQAFEATPKRHALAVAVGLIPALGAWAYMLIEQTLLKVGSTVHAAQDSFGRSPADIFLHGAIALNQGFIVTSMIFAAVMAFVVDRQFHKAAAWTAVAAILSMLGVIHAYELTEAGLFTHFGLWQAPQFALAYWATTALLLALHLTGYSRAAEGELADGF